MSSILMNNFPRKFGSLSVHSDGQWQKPSSFMGYSLTQYEFFKAQLEAIRKLFLNLLLHDVIYIRHADYFLCIGLLGHENVLKLLESGALKVVFDSVDFSFMAGFGKMKLKALTRRSYIENMVGDYSNIQHDDSYIQSRLRYLTDENKVLLPDQFLTHLEKDGGKQVHKIIAEVKKNYSVRTEKIKKKTGGMQLSHLKNKTSMLRTCELLYGYSIQYELNVDSIAQDAFAKKYMEKNILIPAGISNSTECFETILSLKGIPDLLDLYINDVISFDDVLAIRENTKAKTFRQWMLSNDYDEATITEYLLRPCKPKFNSKMMSFIYPNIIGLINPLGGIAASAVDSFLLDWIQNNWNPKIFLDDELAKTIDTKITAFESQKKKERVNNYINIGLTDPCYCGSGQRFGKCCGK